MNRTYLRGDMYFADLGQCIGSEQEGNRPVVIIQNDVGNRHSPTVIVAAVTTQKENKRKLPTHYYIGPENGLGRPSIVLLEQLRTIDKKRLGRYVGRLNKKQLAELDDALAISLSLEQHDPDALVMSLCGVCADNFRNTGAYFLRRVDPNQSVKETCTYCNQRRGFDYIVVKKS
ncbi:MAG: type II toxin-antitoxin system PemK/MazF family toxin [Eubacteriales bacterium]|nr:type II toxin-antitoxin system PemK/MazF family toxin [Eubacteriales bacterium]